MRNLGDCTCCDRRGGNDCRSIGGHLGSNGRSAGIRSKWDSGGLNRSASGTNPVDIGDKWKWFVVSINGATKNVSQLCLAYIGRPGPEVSGCHPRTLKLLLRFLECLDPFLPLSALAEERVTSFPHFSIVSRRMSP
jgi:hypothetical protein